MSWQRARDEAERWIDRLQLGKVKGRTIDLTQNVPDYVKNAKPAWRNMILQAAARALKSRGAVDVILPEFPTTDPFAE
jgi:hypothetical protein